MKHRAKNSTTWASVIAARQQTPEAIADAAMAKLYSAYADLKAGTTDDDMFDRVAAAINVGLIRAEQIDAACVTPMLEARDALIRCDAIRGKHGRYGFDGPGLQAMAAGLEVYEEMLRKSTPLQMRQALTASMERMRLQIAAGANL
ncbi:hypothetical protein [Variovorax atrisoli]|uniref:hypothetical protein n=1 Tax=Variovorax atrisoli TaxID=3394203 RepID=UPI00160E6A8D|nr:hypothetical protein [Variovorax sp. BK613]MBB3642578.1 hypothetical protein [Variovorax sp. BK613]